jgi:magnesium transporter
MSQPYNNQAGGPSQARAGNTRSDVTGSTTGEARKKKKHRAGKKKRNRRQSFVAQEDVPGVNSDSERPSLLKAPGSHSEAREGFYRVVRGNVSATSLESEALLDHRYFFGPMNDGVMESIC